MSLLLCPSITSPYPEEGMRVEKCSESGIEVYYCVHCPYSTPHKGNLKAHLNTHSDIRPFVCSVCMKGFKQKYTLKKHFRLHSGERPYKCDVYPEEGMCVEKCSERGFDVYYCVHCSYSTPYKHHLKRHLSIHSDVRPFVCSVCKRGFKQKDYLRTHFRQHSGERPYKCDVCEKKFANPEEGMRVEKCSERGFDVFYCLHCSYSTPHKHHLKTHLNIHSDVRPFVCSVCMRAFKQKDYLRKHFRLHSGERPYKCDVCFEQVSLYPDECCECGFEVYYCVYCLFSTLCLEQVSLYPEWVRVEKCPERGFDVYYCGHCSYATPFKSKFKVHFNTHNDGRPFICTVCMRGFRQKHTLKKHFRRHSGERPYKCEVDLSSCLVEVIVIRVKLTNIQKKGCVLRNALKEVLMCSYIRDKNTAVTEIGFMSIHACPYCRYVTPNTGCLKRHLRTHSGEELLGAKIVIHDGVPIYHCLHCSYSTPYKWNLKTHRLIHSGERPFACSICSNLRDKSAVVPDVVSFLRACPHCSYVTPSTGCLNRHLRTHSGERPFTCKICFKSFSQKSNLRRHFLIHIKPPTQSNLNEGEL
ncbi:zinc finger protein 26-like [Argiope bruennichi]|uniref:zinc finger protein 26-like n=1 Tax=Argiope bruennichi TaxID=94029 RepID=UPI002494EAC1|nr:zinc finger protein 26-like [Argiope bruennichi]